MIKPLSTTTLSNVAESFISLNQCVQNSNCLPTPWILSVVYRAFSNRFSLISTTIYERSTTVLVLLLRKLMLKKVKCWVHGIQPVNKRPRLKPRSSDDEPSVFFFIPQLLPGLVSLQRPLVLHVSMSFLSDTVRQIIRSCPFSEDTQIWWL